MSGSARSLEVHMFAGLRVASTTYYPAHSKNGKNVSARLVINAFKNIASSANDGEGRNEVIQLTAWGKLADICAKSMSPGKEFNSTCDLHVYDGRVFHNSQPVQMADGTVLTTKKQSYTIVRLTFGEESNKLIAHEMQAMLNGKPMRPAGWNQVGSADHAEWVLTLKARQAVQFDSNLPTFGYARVIIPAGQGIAAYNPQLDNRQAPLAGAVENAVVNAAANPAVVNNAFATPAENAAPIETAAPASAFTVPGV